MNRKVPACIYLSALSMILCTAFAGEISGTVKWEGSVPKMRPIKMEADAACTAHHSETPTSESLVVGANGGLANVLVRVKSGLPAGKTYSPPAEAAVIDQKGCMYIPHVMGVMVNQDLRILNSDGILHNVKVLAKENRPFNIGMPKTMKETVKKFSKAEDAVQFKCNVHPWMGAYVHVLSHPYFAVTGKDGAYTIKGLPAGTYEIEAWHESKRLKSQIVTVTVGDSDKKSQDFTFKRPPKKK